MRKTSLFFLLLLISMSMSLFAQTTIHSNACASATAGWTFTNAGAQIIQQTGYWLVEDVGDAIISEPFNVTSYTGLTLTFKVGTYGTGTNHSCLVEYSTNNGTSWNATTFTSATPTSSTMITAGTWNLGTISATQFKLRWTIPSGGSKGVRIDDILFQGTASTPTINVSTATLSGFTYVYGNGPSTPEKTFTITGTNMTNNISVAATTNYEISKSSGTGYTTPLVYTPAEAATAQTIYVRLKSGLAIGTYNSEVITASSTGATDKTVTCSGTVTTPPAPVAPVTTAATNVTSNAFRANWNSVSGANSYLIDVYTSTTGTTTLNEGFEGYVTATPPAGWSLSSTGSYLQNAVANAHGGTYFGGMNAVNGWVQSPLVTNPTTMTFWGRTSAASAVYTAKVQTSTNGTDWADQATYTASAGDTGTITSVYNQFTVNINLTGSYYIRWFISARTGGSFYFDDVAISYTGSVLTYKLQNQAVPAGTSYDVTSLDANTAYSYVVRAVGTYGTSTNSNPTTATTLASYTVAITSSPSGAAIKLNNVATGHVTPYTFNMDANTSGTYTVEKAGYSYSPASKVVTNIAANTSQFFTGALHIYTVDITSTPNYAHIKLNNVDTGLTTPHQFIMDWHTSATFSVELAGYSFTPSSATITDIEANTTQDFVGSLLPAVPATIPTPLPDNVDITVLTTIDLYNGPNLLITDSIVQLLPNVNSLLTPAIFTYSAVGTGDVSFNVPNGVWYGVAYYNGTWNNGNPYPCNGPGAITFTNVPFGSKGDIQFVLGQGNDPSLPIELSSFTATATSQYFVVLNWTTQSETNVAGYYIYRNNSTDLNSAIKIPTLIPATNTSNEANYNFTDQEVSGNGTWYYWLQNIDMSGNSNFHGPISVMLNNGGGDDPMPVVPVVTELKGMYPNPFSTSGIISYNLAKAAKVTLEIYNLRGEKVRSLMSDSKGVGAWRAAWNGTDNNGRACTSGIYYIKMTAGKYTSTQKVVLVK